jgi:recombination protein RecT
VADCSRRRERAMATQSDKAIERMQQALDADSDAPKTKREQFELFKGKVEAILPAVRAAMPDHVKPDRIMRTIMTAVRTNPELLDCSMDSLLAGTLLSAQLGLEIGPLGHAYLVPFNRNQKLANGEWRTVKEATFIIGYRGELDLARRSGNIASIYAYPVFEGDEFSFGLGLQPMLEHKPIGEDEPDKITHFYSVAHLVGGGYQFEVMTRAQVDAVMRRSKGSGKCHQDKDGIWRAEYGPWQSDYAEMGRKTVLRRLFKWLPVSVEIQQAFAADETIRHGIAADMLALPDVSESEDLFEGADDEQALVETPGEIVVGSPKVESISSPDEVATTHTSKKPRRSLQDVVVDAALSTDEAEGSLPLE